VIGGIDNNVIKDSEGVPFIPGSSLKGKMRSLLEKKKGKDRVCNCGNCNICAIFGKGAGNEDEELRVGPTRVYVRDAMLDGETKKDMEEKKGMFAELELTYTESKWENVIDRKISKADHPRQQERVPAGARFDLYLVFNILQNEDIERFGDVIVALRLLEDDYLGGNGSRGYGRIKFDDLSISIKTTEDYESDNKDREVYNGTLDRLSFSQIKQKISELIGIDGYENI